MTKNAIVVCQSRVDRCQMIEFSPESFSQFVLVYQFSMLYIILPQTEWLKMTLIYQLTVLQISFLGRLGWNLTLGFSKVKGILWARLFLKALWRNPLQSSSGCWQNSAPCSCGTGISASSLAIGQGGSPLFPEIACTSWHVTTPFHIQNRE